jgi:hypothetical protein
VLQYKEETIITEARHTMASPAAFNQWVSTT